MESDGPGQQSWSAPPGAGGASTPPGSPAGPPADDGWSWRPPADPTTVSLTSDVAASAGAAPTAPPPPPLPPYPTGGAGGSGTGRGPGRLIVAITSVFALLVAGGFAVWSLSQPDGAGDPETAVRNLFTAVDQEDLVGALEVLPPSERTILRDGVLDAVNDLQRLGILSSFDPAKVPGAEFEVEDLQLASTQLGEDVVSVEVTGGTISGRSRIKDLPVGDLLRPHVQEDLDEAKDEAFTEDLGDADLKLAAVREDGGWHVSLFYTIAEAARGDMPAPLFGQGPTPLGSDTPEGAVRELVAAGVALDAEKAIRMTPPDEMRVLYDYSSLFLPDAREAAREAKEDGFNLTVDRLDLRSEGDGDRRRVFVDGVGVSGGDGDSQGSFTWDGRCVRVESTNSYSSGSSSGSSGSGGGRTNRQPRTEKDEYCVGEGAKGDTTNGTSGYRSSDEEMFGALSSTDALQPGITVVLVDGRWYVSPTRTLLDTMLRSLRAADREDVEKVFGSQGMFGSGPGSRFEPIGPLTTGTTRSSRTTPTTARRSTTTTLDTSQLDACLDALEFPDATTPDGLTAEVVRARYQYEKAMNACYEQHVGASATIEPDPCFEPYEELGTNDSEERWQIADGAVLRCFDSFMGGGTGGDDGSTGGTLVPPDAPATVTTPPPSVGPDS